MPKLVVSTPKYRQHTRGNATVRIGGRDIYLGRFNSPESKAKYHRLIAEWEANNRTARPATPFPGEAITCDYIALQYLDYASRHYVKNGQPMSIAGIKTAAELLCRYYGDVEATDFDAVSLENLMQCMVRAGYAHSVTKKRSNYSRTTVNRTAITIRKMFKWAAKYKLVPVGIYEQLTTAEGLRRGQTEAREPAPIEPVDDATVDATLPHLPDVVADMVRFQRLTGARPGEICILRPCDVDQTGEVWKYRPESHKTEHHSRDRIIFIGPRAQDVLRRYLVREKSSCCFSPQDSEQKRLDQRHEQRVTPLGYGNRPGTNRVRRPKREAGERYSTASYRRAVERAVEAANRQRQKIAKEGEKVELLQRWGPNRLRHTAASEVRKQFGLDAAQAVLGHARADVTQVYAERDQAKAIEAMRLIG